MAGLTDLPVELWVRIVQLARDDPRDLARMLALARTSRALHSVVQPLLYETVCITRNNYQQIVAKCSAVSPAPSASPNPVGVVRHNLSSLFHRDVAPGIIEEVPFRHTRRLLVLGWELGIDTLAWTFSRTTAFAGNQHQFEELAVDALDQDLFAPTMLVLTARYTQLDLEAMLHRPAVHTATHLHTCFADSGWVFPVPHVENVRIDFSHVRFTHAILESHSHSDWRDHVIAVAKHFLAIATLQRLLLCMQPGDEPWGVSWPTLAEPLTEFARSRKETRVWIKPVVYLHGIQASCPCNLQERDVVGTFDHNKWFDGQPLY